MADEYDYIVIIDGFIRSFPSIDSAYDYVSKVRKKHGISHVYRSTLAKELRRLANYLDSCPDKDIMARNISLLMNHVHGAESGFDTSCYAIEEYPTSSYRVWPCTEEDALFHALQYVLSRKDAGTYKYGITKSERKRIVPISLRMSEEAFGKLSFIANKSDCSPDTVVQCLVNKYLDEEYA